MRILRFAAAMAAGMIVIAGCQQATVDVVAVETEHKNALRAWITAFNAGDIEAIVVQYAPDAIVMAPGNAAAAGHDAIRALITKESEAARGGGISLAVNDDDDIGVSGDVAWHSGGYTVNDASGNAIDSGNYLAVSRNVDGKWLIIRDTWNSDRPPAPPPAEPAAGEAAAP